MYKICREGHLAAEDGRARIKPLHLDSDILQPWIYTSSEYLCMCVYGTIRVRKEKPLTGEGAGETGMEMTYEGLEGEGNDAIAF